MKNIELPAWEHFILQTAQGPLELLMMQVSLEQERKLTAIFTFYMLLKHNGSSLLRNPEFYAGEEVLGWNTAFTLSLLETYHILIPPGQIDLHLPKQTSCLSPSNLSMLMPFPFCKGHPFLLTLLQYPMPKSILSSQTTLLIFSVIPVSTICLKSIFCFPIKS